MPRQGRAESKTTLFSEGVNKTVFILEFPELFESLLLLSNSLLEKSLTESVSILGADTEVATHLMCRQLTRTNSLHECRAGNTDALRRNRRRQIVRDNLNIDTLPVSQGMQDMLNDLAEGIAKLLAFSARNGQLNGDFFRVLKNLPCLCASLIEGIFLQRAG